MCSNPADSVEEGSECGGDGGTRGVDLEAIAFYDGSDVLLSFATKNEAAKTLE